MTSSSSHSPPKVQHDQIPQSYHSSASYKQELMDASLLLENIKDALLSFDNDNQSSHSLQSPTNTHDNISKLPPNISPYASTKSMIKLRHHKRSKHMHSPSTPVSHTSHYHRSKHKINYKSNHPSISQHNRSHNNDNSHSLPSKVIPPNTMIGPHQAYIIKDDSNEHLQTDHNSVPNHATTVHEIPAFVIQNTRRLQLLKEMIEIKRSELERVSHRHNNTITCIIELYIHAADAINSLRKQYRQLSQFAEQLSREGHKRNIISDKLLQTLINIEEQRKMLLNKIDSPAWEIKHHFHILSFEHFRGNQQPHLLEIAEVLPSRLQIAAIAHSSSIKNDKLLMKFHMAIKERDLLYKKLGQIDNKRNLTQAHLKDYKKMMTIIRKNIGDNRLNKFKQERQRKREIEALEKKNKNFEEKEIQRFSHFSRFRKSPHSLNTHSHISDDFRLNYLRHIGIQTPKKIKFNLSVFVVEVNTFLGIECKTNQELIELKNVSNLINPITGQIRNPTKEKNDSLKINVNDMNEITELKEDMNINNEKLELKSTNVINVESKKKLHSKHKLILKEKHVRQNILSIIDHSILNVEEKNGKNKKKYIVSLRNSIIKEKKKDNESFKNENIEDTNVEENKQSLVKIKKIMDEPHSDWSVLARHLKDSSKESARRKQILKQLERILQVREGLSDGFDRLKAVFDSYENPQIIENK